MNDERAEIVTALREAADAFSEARKIMVGVEAVFRSGAEELEDGTDIMELLTSTRIKELRGELQPALQKMDTTRHRFRLLLTAHCADSGMSAREISELWGFSRQRAQALIQEARELELPPAM